MTTTLPFAGLRVIDLDTYGVGPMIGRYLAYHGAECIKVESSVHVDLIRTVPPFFGGVPGLDRSTYWMEYNAGRVGAALNVAKPRGRELFKRLVRIADVVIENFAGGVAERWGLAYSDLVCERPDLIMLRSNSQGHTGPGANHPGHGATIQALSGFNHLTGWPDGAAIGTGGPYTDFVAPHLGAAALLAALDYRRRTGKGQEIDVSQMEAAMPFLNPALLDYAVNNRVQLRNGNRDAYKAPHAAFPCAGPGADRWIAIAVETDDEWRALCKEMGEPEWALDPALATVDGRLTREDELEERIGRWTADQDAFELMHRLQAAGVPAGVVQHGGDLLQDPQITHRGHYVPREHAVIGTHLYEASSFRLSKTPGGPPRAAPALGQHNEYVFRELLGLHDDEIADLMAAGDLQ